MEQLAVSQTEIYDSLVKLLSNIKKDGADRKTIDYLQAQVRNFRKLLERVSTKP